VTVNSNGPALFVVVDSDVVNVGDNTSTTPVTVAVADDPPEKVPEYSTR
jgi:hypothetical protein